ncbi:amyloid-beta A4 precursor protein-binding family B member 3 isoform X2 [Protopterus annectens]|uniref:amyloid-beta A4 precursor protein-binding family B member 3 isoform X2 n=1 Tax=Protopterus annectens TaxID=7888 RepID=UPI001CFC3ECE|nr:amyloid-beta A4 precursor protein-binding family B member 3 isoform X2 [Protopterus annectens]
MLGKDYMLAIIIVNYDDNLWNDQNLDSDPDLPHGWRTIRDSTGTYYWHVPTGTTQWQHPSFTSTIEHSLDTDFHSIDGKDRSKTAMAHCSEGAKLESQGQAATKRISLPWQDEEFSQSFGEAGSKCFAVRSLGWVEIPEEDLAPGKSSIAVNNCIQQLSHSKCEGRDAIGAWGEGQDMVMILKKDTLSLVDPVDHTLIHCQPIINIRVWGVGCNYGRDFAFVASDKDTCMLKCHVFRCDVPAKAIATALHDLCSKIMAERAIMCKPILKRSITMESISPEDLPLQVDILDAVRQTTQKFEVLFIGSLPVSKPMGMDILNSSIDKLLNITDRRLWEPALIRVSESTVTVQQGEATDDDVIWECQVRYLTFIGVGKDARTFAVIVDTGCQRFECRVFWCEPDAGNVSECIQAACMVQYQKCLVAKAPSVKTKSSHSKMGSKLKRTTSVDPSSHSGHSVQKHRSSSVKRGVMSLFDSLKQKQSV